MEDLTKLTVDELGLEMSKRNASFDASVKECFRRLKESEDGKPPVVIEPPPVEKPDPPGLDASEIIALVESNMPNVADMLDHQFDAQPKFGEVGFKEAWTLKAGTDYVRKRWHGFDGADRDTNAFIRVPGSLGGYGYLDQTRIFESMVESAGKWGMRLYGVRSCVDIVDTLFRDIEWEHGLYANLCGGLADEGAALSIYDCVFQNCASQAIQLVQRDSMWEPGDKDYSGETPNMEADMTPGGAIVIRRTLVERCGLPTGARPSFNLSFFGSRNAVDFTNVMIDNREMEESRGFLLAQGYHGLEDPFERVLEAEYFVFRSARSAQESMKFERMSRVSMSHGVIDVPPGTQAKIRLVNCAEWDFENITSLNEPVRVEIDGKDAGTIDELSGAK